ncbi:hypothetical protein D3C71_1865800 [compost metagenome]
MRAALRCNRRERPLIDLELRTRNQVFGPDVAAQAPAHPVVVKADSGLAIGGDIHAVLIAIGALAGDSLVRSDQVGRAVTIREVHREVGEDCGRQF